MPALVVRALAALAWLGGGNRFSACVLLCFHCMLRPGELFALERRHLLFADWEAAAHEAGDSHQRVGLGIALAFDTKTSVAKRVHEHVFVREPLLARLLKHVFLALPQGERLWPGTPAAFRAACDAYMLQLNLQGCGFRLYSLRRGGATHDFRSHGSWDITCDRGRWGDANTARIYLKDALASSIQESFAPALRERLSFLSGAFTNAISSL